MEKRKAESELIGQLLLTHARDIPRGAKNIRLKNVFSAGQEMIDIKLDPARSVSENAKKYFDKYKNIAEKKRNLSVKRDTLQAEMRHWQTLSDRLQLADSPEKLTALYRKLGIRENGKNEKAVTDDRTQFKRLLLEKRWEVLIGRNARNNDLLTFKFAHKYDLWLHARDTAGSHVIIRSGGKDQRPPADIIAQAASVAAWHSGNRNSGNVPVDYTQVRYVRKPRKAAPGLVNITHAKTIFVKPQKLI